MTKVANAGTIEQVRKMVGDGAAKNQRHGRGKKHGNTHVELDGIKFDSRLEADVWCRLRAMEKGERPQIRNLRRQVRYEFEHVNPFGQVIRITAYVADFVFEERGNVRHGVREWKEVVADAKGFRTEKYQLKKKLMLAFYGIEIREYR